MWIPPRTSLEKLRIGAGSTLVLSSVLLLSPLGASTRTAEAAVARTELRVHGVPIARMTDVRAESSRLARRFLDAPLAVRIGTREIATTRRALGVTIDEATFAEWLGRASDPDSRIPQNRPARRGVAVDPLEVPMPFTFEENRLRTLLLEAKDSVDSAPENARVDLETGAIVPEKEGLALDVFGTLQAFREGLFDDAETFDAKFAHTPASRVAAQLEGVSIAATLGEFETHYNPSIEVADRTHNLKVAAQRIDGMVLLPGEEFGFNDVVGERTALAGFRDAPVISGGELAEGLGGGTCRISGTLHAAVFFAGLPILERQPHSRPSSYIKLGLDAMVAWPSLDFRFRNDFAHPIVLRLSVERGIVRARILGPERSKSVTFVRRIDQVVPFEERLENDPTLPAGVRVLVQRGVPGFGVARARIVRDARTHEERTERMHDSYPPTVQIRRVGTGPRAARGYVAPLGDRHLEYRADSYAEMVQGPEVTGTIERNSAGQTGTPGWTVRAGMPPAE